MNRNTRATNKPADEDFSNFNGAPDIIPTKKKKIVHKVKTFQGESDFIIPNGNTMIDTDNDTIITSGVGGVDVVGVNDNYANMINVPTCNTTPSTPTPTTPPSTPICSGGTPPTSSGPTTTTGGGPITGGPSTTPPTPICSGGTTPTTTTGGGPITSTPPPSTPTGPTNAGSSGVAPTFILLPNVGTITSGDVPTFTPTPSATPTGTPVFSGGGGGGIAPSEQGGEEMQQGFFEKNKMLIGAMLIAGIAIYFIAKNKKQS